MGPPAHPAGTPDQAVEGQDHQVADQDKQPGTHQTSSGYDLYSAGPDRQPDNQDDVGNWQGPPGTSLAASVFEGALEPNSLNLPTNLSVADVPFQPWAREVYDLRQSSFTKEIGRAHV